MAFPNMIVSLFSLFSFLLFLSAQSKLTPDYYSKTCPKFQEVLTRVVSGKQQSNPAAAAATLRVFFHDCFINGCDASLLIASNSFNKSELDANANLATAGDAFDLIHRVKTSLELECPGIVSCSDILAVSARDLVGMLGGPKYEVLLGRKDGRESSPKDVEKHVPQALMPMNDLVNLFQSKGFSIEEMVALAGAHTIGFAHCSQFANRLFNFSKTSDVDPAYNPTFAQGLKKLCQNYTNDPTMSAFIDVYTPMKFDNMYYKNLQRGLGLLSSDQALATDVRTKPFVDTFAANEKAFFDLFARSMQKLSELQIKEGDAGDLRNPSHISFSYAIALQNTCLKTWGGRPENVKAAQNALLVRANSLAQLGKSTGEGELDEAKVGMFVKGYVY